jgi:hypothetical protein
MDTMSCHVRPMFFNFSRPDRTLVMLVAENGAKLLASRFFSLCHYGHGQIIP